MLISLYHQEQRRRKLSLVTLAEAAPLRRFDGNEHSDPVAAVYSELWCDFGQQLVGSALAKTCTRIRPSS